MKILLDFYVKKFTAAMLFAVSFCLYASCSNEVIAENFRFETPALPEIWVETLGQPHWRFEWFNGSGQWQHADTASPAYSNADLLTDTASPVLAYPYWPEFGLPAGVMKPAGAIFPLDARRETIKLSFSGGVDAVFYRELALASTGKRLPMHFDWLRFRGLWTGQKIHEDVRRDPWLVDWKLVAEKTISSGFSAKRIKPRDTENLLVTVPADGPWFNVSPFMPAADWVQGSLRAFVVSETVDTFFSKEGILRVAQKSWSWLPLR